MWKQPASKGRVYDGWWYKLNSCSSFLWKTDTWVRCKLVVDKILCECVSEWESTIYFLFLKCAVQTLPFSSEVDFQVETIVGPVWWSPVFNWDMEKDENKLGVVFSGAALWLFLEAMCKHMPAHAHTHTSRSGKRGVWKSGASPHLSRWIGSEFQLFSPAFLHAAVGNLRFCIIKG